MPTRSPPRPIPPLQDLFTILDYLTLSTAYSNDELVAQSLFRPTVTATLAAILQQGKTIMATLQDLQAQLDSITSTETSEATGLADMNTALGTMGTALATIITDLQNLPPAGVLTQAELDAAVQKATDLAASSAANAASVAANAAQVAADNAAAVAAATPATGGTPASA